MLALTLVATALPSAFAFSAPVHAGVMALRAHPSATSFHGIGGRISVGSIDGSRSRISGTGSLQMGIEGTGIYIGAGLYYGQWKTGVVVNSVLAAIMFVTKKYKSALTETGLLNAWILGILLWGPLGAAGWATCFMYLVFGSLVTKVKMAEKEAKGIAEGRGGQRGPENVWGSAATAAVCALMSQLSPWDSALFKLGFVASLATKLSDTCGSEIGKAYGKTTYLITTLESVPPGTEGAISVEGTLAGVVGSVLLGLCGLAANLIEPMGVWICVFAAFVGTNCESVIGAVFQNKYSWLTNEVVNFINTAIGAAVAMSVYLLL